MSNYNGLGKLDNILRKIMNLIYNKITRNGRLIIEEKWLKIPTL